MSPTGRARPLDLTQIQDLLLWLAERTDVRQPQTAGVTSNPTVITGVYERVCWFCGHSRAAHQMDTEFQACQYPKSILGAPHALCRCNDYQEMRDDD